MSHRTTILSWALQCIAAVILLQTLYFKFTGAAESRSIFETLGMEPAGRIASGIAELIGVVLLLTPHTSVFGAALVLGIMAGAIAGHLTLLGIEVQNDGGLLFALALVVFASCSAILFLRRVYIPVIGPRLAPARA